jgi:hypothetical protein
LGLGFLDGEIVLKGVETLLEYIDPGSARVFDCECSVGLGQCHGDETSWFDIL